MNRLLLLTLLVLVGCSGTNARRVEGGDPRNRNEQFRPRIEFVPPPRVDARSPGTRDVSVAPPLENRGGSTITSGDSSLERYVPPQPEPGSNVESRRARQSYRHVQVVYPDHYDRFDDFYAPTYRPVRHYRPRYDPYRRRFDPRHYDHPRYRRRTTFPWNTLLLGTAGGIIGHQSGRRDEGVLIGAGVGLLTDLFAR